MVALRRRSLLLLLLQTALFSIDVLPVAQEDVRCFHRHPAEVGDEVRTVRVTGDVAFSTTTSVLAAKREHVTTMATPVRANVGNWFESVGNTMVDLLRIVVLTRIGEPNAKRRLSALTPVFDFDIHFVTTFS